MITHKYKRQQMNHPSNQINLGTENLSFVQSLLEITLTKKNYETEEKLDCGVFFLRLITILI